MTMKQALDSRAEVNRGMRRALNGLAGCPGGGWPETQQAIDRIYDAAPHRDNRKWSVAELIDAALVVTGPDSGRWVWRTEVEAVTP